MLTFLVTVECLECGALDHVEDGAAAQLWMDDHDCENADDAGPSSDL